MSLGPRRHAICTFTSGLPDAGSALTRKFIQPAASDHPAAIDAVVQQNSSAEAASGLEHPQPEVPLVPTQELPSFSQRSDDVRSEHTQEKRQRVNGEEYMPDESQDDLQDFRDIVSQLTESLAQPNKATLSSLTKEVRSAHTKYLDLQRQIAAIKEKLSNRENPHGWKIRAVPLGITNAGLEQKIIDEQNSAAQLCLQHILDAKLADAAAAYKERADALDAAIRRHKASVERIMAGNPFRYSEVNPAAVMESAKCILATTAIRAEVEADQAYDIRAQKRADKQLAFQEKQKSEQEQLQDPDAAVTHAELQQMKKELQEELAKARKKPRGRPPKAARDTASNSTSSHTSNTYRQKSNGKNNVSKAYRQKSNGNNSVSKDGTSHRQQQQQGRSQQRGKGHQQGKGQHTRQASPSLAVTKRTVINLSPTPAPVTLVRALGLGPSFRPTPRPLSDEQLVKAIRHFSNRVKTAAFHVLFPSDNPQEYNPRLYVPTNNKCDPDCPALDSCLDEYQSVIESALTLSHTQPKSNMSKSERTALHELAKDLDLGTAVHIPLVADKDRAYTLVSQSQHTHLWCSAMSGTQFTKVEPDIVDWASVKRRVRFVADSALEQGVISNSTHRYVTQHCTGPVRQPRGNLLVKTHKHMKPCTAVPAKTRLYIDTVNCVTTPLARYISVMLTPAREQICHRIKDTRHLMYMLSNMTFSQSVRLIIIDVTDFYPNTNTTDGEAVMVKRLPPELASLCVKFSKLIHESMVVSTPVGSFKVPDSYGIGFGHSAEVCDLSYADTVEQPILSALSREGIVPAFYGRMIDDIIMIVDCTDAEVNRIEHLFQSTDPSKPVTFKHSMQSADYLDVTLFKGPQFILTGKLDSKQYTKPSSSGLHLPRQSHHPEATFSSILSGSVRRSVIACSSLSNHQMEMAKKRRQYNMRGYGLHALTLSLGLQKQTRKRREKYEKLRSLYLQPKVKADGRDRVIALKIPFTCRTTLLQKHLNLQKLQKHIHTHCPALSRASLGRFVIAHLKTSNIRQIARYKTPAE